MNKRRIKKAIQKIRLGKKLTDKENRACYNGNGDFTKNAIKKAKIERGI